jgi:hypothetical protein
MDKSAPHEKVGLPIPMGAATISARGAGRYISKDGINVGEPEQLLLAAGASVPGLTQSKRFLG